MRQLRRASIAVAISLMVASLSVSASDRTADLAGYISGDSGQPVAGATVTVTNQGTGWVTTTTTDSEGRYRLRDLPPGGPYTITSSAGPSVSGVVLNMARPNTVNLSAAPMSTLDAVTVRGQARTQAGSGLMLTRDEIQQVPSIDATVTNAVRLNPNFQVTNRATNEVSVLGQNPRYNVLRLDGLDVGDTFGLETSTQPTPRQPFLLSSIESLSAVAVDYDASSPGAVGGVINAVTRSGTNALHGSVFGTFRDNSMVRDNADGTDFSGFDSERAYGFNLGGPLIKDRLFFFIDAEDYRLRAPAPSFGPIGSGADNIVKVTQAEIDQVRNIALNKYGFDPGTIGGASNADTTATTWSAKVDWLISDAHRLVYRHSATDQSQANFPGFAPNSLAFSSYGYQRTFDLDTDTLQWLATWNDRVATNASLSHRTYTTERVPNSSLPAVGVLVNSSAILFMGTEENSFLNRLETENWNAAFSAQVAMGAHDVEVGTDWSRNNVNNLYGRRVNGTYGFFGINRFNLGVATPFRFSYPAGGDPQSFAADWALDNLGVFIQDRWTVTDKLSLTMGLRYDRTHVGDTPLFNAKAETTFGYDNRETLDGEGLLQPRLSFDYAAAEGLTLRGGVGRFRGQSPAVWLSNPFSNTGLNYIDYNFPVFMGFNRDPNNQITSVPRNAVGATQSVDLIDPAASQPSIWKANLAVEANLPWWGASAGAELVVSRVDQALYYRNLNLGAPTGTGSDGRLLYWNAAGYLPANFDVAGTPRNTVRARSLANPGFSDVLLASPTDKGGSTQLSLQISKPFAQTDWAWSLAYVYTNAREVSPLGSANSASLFGGRPTFNPNDNVSSRSLYEIRDRLIGTLRWEHAFFGGLRTNASLFYEGRSGRPYSFVFDNDANGDGVAGNDLLYVPAGPGDVVFGSAAEEAAFLALIESSSYLSSRRGTTVQRNDARAGWVNQFDLRVSQELPGFAGGHKALVWLDVLNVGNLLNKDWGRIEDLQYPANLGVVEYGGVCGATPAGRCTAGDQGKYVYRFNTPDALAFYDERGVSRWSLQLGFQYSF